MLIFLKFFNITLVPQLILLHVPALHLSDLKESIIMAIRICTLSKSVILDKTFNYKVKYSVSNSSCWLFRRNYRTNAVIVVI